MNRYNKPGDNSAGREELLSDVGVKVALALGDDTDRKWFTDLVGKRSVRTQSESRQRNRDSTTIGRSMNETADDLIHMWDWTHRSPDVDGAIVVKAKENNADGRNGVFRMPLVDATKTPAKRFFGLGTKEQETKKRLAYRAQLDAKAHSVDLKVPTWCPDFEEFTSEETQRNQLANDEVSAWDLGADL